MKIERLKKYILPAGLFCAGLIALSALRSTETMAPALLPDRSRWRS